MVSLVTRVSLLLSAIFLLFSCAETVNPNQTSSSGGAVSNNKIYTLSWAAPSTFENGDALTLETDILEYRVYYGASSTSLINNFIVVAPTEKSVSTGSLDQSIINSLSTVYLAMTAVSTEGVESSLSTIVSFNPK